MTAIPLGLMQCGSEAAIKDILTPERVKCRLFELGLVPGSLIRIIKNDPGGPLIISLQDMRLALGQGMSMLITVEEKIAPVIFSPELVYTNLRRGKPPGVTINAK
ncbi:MAG: ferrous iron transport protein A [Dehalococcoidales bacterium]|nr:ferrous iron transport protein A [Dehalococcoidales bacterium]